MNIKRFIIPIAVILAIVGIALYLNENRNKTIVDEIIERSNKITEEQLSLARGNLTKPDSLMLLLDALTGQNTARQQNIILFLKNHPEHALPAIKDRIELIVQQSKMTNHTGTPTWEKPHGETLHHYLKAYIDIGKTIRPLEFKSKDIIFQLRIQESFTQGIGPLKSTHFQHHYNGPVIEQFINNLPSSTMITQNPKHTFIYGDLTKENLMPTLNQIEQYFHTKPPATNNNSPNE